MPYTGASAPCQGNPHETGFLPEMIRRVLGTARRVKPRPTRSFQDSWPANITALPRRGHPDTRSAFSSRSKL